MGTTLASKQDLVLLRQEMRQDVALLRQEMTGMRTELRQEINTLELRMIVKLGSMLFIGFGLTIAALQLWS